MDAKKLMHFEATEALKSELEDSKRISNETIESLKENLNVVINQLKMNEISHEKTCEELRTELTKT